MQMRRCFTIIRIRSRMHKTHTSQRHVGAGLASRWRLGRVTGRSGSEGRRLTRVFRHARLQEDSRRPSASRPMRSGA